MRIAVGDKTTPGEEINFLDFKKRKSDDKTAKGSPNVLNIQIINRSSDLSDGSDSRKDEKSYTVTEFIIPAAGETIGESSAGKKQNGRAKSKKSHKCEYCSKVFMWKSVLAEHRRTHTKEKPHKCGICGVGFGSYAGLYKHRVVHVSDKPFECQICQKSFKRSIQLKYHMEVHTGTETLKCDSCGYSTTSKRYMQLHKDTHKSKLKYVCEICNKGFNAKSYLIEHFNKHSGLRPFLCDVCGKSYPAKTSLSIHFQMKHDPTYKPIDKRQCNTCGKMVLNRTQDIARHARTHKKERLCHICGQNLNKGETLKDHLRLHCEKRFYCETCKISFKTKVLLDTHNKIHESKDTRILQIEPQIIASQNSDVEDTLDVLHQVVIAAPQAPDTETFGNSQEIIYFNIKNDSILTEANNIQTFIFAP